MKLTKDEADLLNSVENDDWKSIPDFTDQSVRYREAARATLRKDKRINIRITERDLVRLKKTAMREGLPYQTMISSILHKFINGRLVENVESLAEQ